MVPRAERDHPGPDRPSLLIEAYERHLTGSRGLAALTVRNYLADLAPFEEYLDAQGLALERHARGLRAFVERLGRDHVAREYRNLIRDYVSWLLEHRRLRGGDRTGQRGHSRGSVVRALAALRSFVRFLIDSRLVPDAALWAPRSTLMRRFTPRTIQRLPDIVSPAEAARLVEAPRAPLARLPSGESARRLRDAALLEVLYGGGLRVSEAAGLDVAHVALADCIARVWGKGSKARMVPLGGPAVRALRAYLHGGRPTLAGPRSGMALFLNARGGRLTPRSIQSVVRCYALVAGLRAGVHPHTLRHSFATHLLDGGADLRVVQELLGHSTPSATQVYTHVSQVEARRVYLAAHPLARGSRRERSGGRNSVRLAGRG